MRIYRPLLVRVALLAILVALSPAAITPEVFAQQAKRQSTNKERFEEGIVKIRNQDYKGGAEVLDKLKIDSDDRLAARDKAFIDFMLATATEQNNADAQFNLGECYENGKGVEQSWTEVSL